MSDNVAGVTVVIFFTTLMILTLNNGEGIDLLDAIINIVNK